MKTSVDAYFARNPVRSWAELEAIESLTPYADSDTEPTVEIVPEEEEPFELRAARVKINGTKTMIGLPRPNGIQRLAAKVAPVLLVLLAACGPAERNVDSPDPLSYQVDPELAAFFEGASERVLGASGVVLTDDGVSRVRAVAELPSLEPGDEENYDCGHTETAYYRDPFAVVSVDIQILWPQPAYCDAGKTVLHELIHSLRRDVLASEGTTGHASDGVYRHDAGNGKLTESSLTAVCEGVDCSTFNPER